MGVGDGENGVVDLADERGLDCEAVELVVFDGFGIVHKNKKR